MFEPLEFLGKLAALTPRPEINLLLYHGVLAPHARWRRGSPAGAVLDTGRGGCAVSRSSGSGLTLSAGPPGGTGDTVEKGLYSDNTAQMFAMLSNIIRDYNETANTITQNLR